MVAPIIELSGARLRPLRSRMPWRGTGTSATRSSRVTSYPAMSLPAVESMIERCLAGYASDTSCTWAIVAQEDMLLTCGFCLLSRGQQVAELAYDLARPYWGRGLVSQSVAACLRLGLREPGNHACRRLRHGWQRAIGEATRPREVLEASTTTGLQGMPRRTAGLQLVQSLEVRAGSDSGCRLTRR